ncbi:TRAP transporter substrate-binding protein [Kushneria aurantia]|uniref:TRAP transporter substrate-binding protein n=1 Tax=Kushneria aurantia TaxID=504092 RepID=A0ABV6FYF0_9GAMM|nr:TRAP transporter substrate-binding protein [Kushneria aurantia]
MSVRLTTLAAAVAAGALAVTLPAQAAQQWNMATPYGDVSFHTKNIKQFAEDVSEATNGELQITVHSGGSLIGHSEIKPSVRRGTVQAGEVFMSTLSNESPVYEIDTLPGLANSYEQAHTLWEVSKPVITGMFAEQGLKPLFSVPWPSQGIYTDFELTDPAQLEGLRMRAPNINTQRYIENLGGIPTETEESDIPTAFSTGRVDGMITSVSTGNAMSAWDYVSDYTDANLWFPKNIVFVNQRAFDRLDDSTQQALMEAAARAEERGWQMSREDQASSAEALREHGMTISEPEGELAAALKAAGDELVEGWRQRADEPALEILSEYRQQESAQ